MTDPKKLIEQVIVGANPDFLIARLGLNEGSPRDAKVLAKEIASKFGGVVVGSRTGWGTDVSKISKNKASTVTSWLKGKGFEDVSGESVYKQLIVHLGSHAWVMTDKKQGLTVRVADTDQIMTGSKMTQLNDLLVNVLYD